MSSDLYAREKHGVRLRRLWRRLHIGIDAKTQEIVAVELTPDDVGDVSEVPGLLYQIDGEVAAMTADGAYDGVSVYSNVLDRHPNAEVSVPPRATAVAGGIPSKQRDDHVASIEKHGRLGWQRCSGYSRRSLGDTTMFRYKSVIGRQLDAWTLPNQRIDAKLGCDALNRLTGLGMPKSIRRR